jgi:hypothetical protein
MRLGGVIRFGGAAHRGEKRKQYVLVSMGQMEIIWISLGAFACIPTMPIVVKRTLRERSGPEKWQLQTTRRYA